MTCWVVIPFKPLGQAKGRLAAALSEERRAQLARAMLGHVVAVAREAPNVDELRLLGPALPGLPGELARLDDPGGGLNPAIAAALDEVARAGASRMIVLFADLPLLTAQDVALLAAAPAESVAIAPDRHGTGTNALSLPLPAARGFTLAFGTDSFAAHSAEAQRLGLALEQIHSQGLARDIDMPEDLPDAERLMSG